MLKEIFAFFKISVIFILLSITIFSFSLQAKAGSEHSDKILVFSKDTVYQLNSFELKKAERLFYGLITINKGTKGCADCHVLTYSDTLNWNPSGFDIASSYSGKRIEALLKVVNDPTGRKMAEVHEGYAISEEQAVLLQAFLEKLNKEKVPGRKPVVNNLFLFILVNVIALIFLIDLLFTHKIPYKVIHLLIIMGATIFIMRTLIVEGINIGRQQNYAPEQPVKFSHQVHAGQNKIDCQYCHNLAEHSKSAGIPSSNLCMNCHLIVVEGTKSGKFEISKISKALEDKKPIEWVRIHNLPDHVFFSHAQHVKVGKLDCAECHGPVNEMDVIYQHADLSMGWCLDCHRTRGVDFTNNEYYKIYEEYHKQIAMGELDSVLVKDIGGTNCMKCHY